MTSPIVNTVSMVPHCPYWLYCNVLWANWEHLDRVVILGNRSDPFISSGIVFECSLFASFHSYDCRRLSVDENPRTDLVRRSRPRLKEEELWPPVFLRRLSESFPALQHLECACNDIR